MANVQLAVAGDDNTQVILSVPGVQGPAGSNLPPSGTTNQVLYKQSNTDYDTAWSFVTSAMIASGTIVNEDVNASAAIAGTKISPNFGSQNVVTTGTSTAASFIPTSSSVPTNGVYLPSANNVAISTNGTGRLFVDSSGSLGLGTSSPSSLLHLNAASGSVQTQYNNGGTSTYIGIDSGFTGCDIAAGGGIRFRYFSGGSYQNGMVLDTSGRLGIGTSSPSGTFTVYDSGNQIVLNAPTSSNSNITFQENGSNKWIAGYVPFISAFRFSNGSSDILTLTNTGNVGIGTTSPGAALEIVGGSANDVNTPAVFIQNDRFLTFKNTTGTWAGAASATTSNNLLIAAVNNLTLATGANADERARIDSSGRLLVGTSTSRAVSDSSGNGPQGRIQIEAANSDALMSIISAGTADAFRAGTLSLGRHRNSTVGGTPTVVQSGDTLGAICFAGGDGTDMLANGASITCQVDGTPGSDDMPGRLVFSTTADGASSPTEHMRIGNEGDVTLSMTPVAGITNTSGNKLIFKGVQLNGQSNNMASIYGVGGSSWGGDLVFTTKPNDGNPGSSPTERMRITNGGFIKTSNTGTYTGATGLYHELRSSLNDTTISVTNTNSSFTGVLVAQGSDTAATASYSFQQMYSSYSGTFDVEFNLRGDGTALADGTWTGGGADYAEFFEWSDGNLEEEDRRGISVVLDGEKIRPALAGEDPIGVISGNPSVVGDAAWNKWSGKYLRDAYGTYILEDYEVVNDEGETVVQQRRKLNPAYDPEAEYIPREQRPEWDCVGLMGKLRIRKGQPTGSRWIKMRDISDSVDEWLVR